MKIRLSLAVAAAAIAMSMSAMPAAAAPINMLEALKSGVATAPLVEKTHGWHGYCAWGAYGLHRHVPGYGRVSCRNRLIRRCWRNKWGIRVCRWR